MANCFYLTYYPQSQVFCSQRHAKSDMTVAISKSLSTSTNGCFTLVGPVDENISKAVSAPLQPPSWWKIAMFRLVTEGVCCWIHRNKYLDTLEVRLLSDVYKHTNLCSRSISVHCMYKWLQQPIIHMYADDTAIVGLFCNNNSITAYEKSISQFSQWCTDNRGNGHTHIQTTPQHSTAHSSKGNP